MKFIWPLILLMFLPACSSLHIQSALPNSASITVQNPRIIENEKYRPFVAINIDGKRAVRKQEDFERDPQSSFLKALIDPGFHKIKIEVTAYNGARAKYEHETIEIELIAQAHYELSVDVPEVVSETMKSDSWAHLILKNIASGKVLLNKKIVLKDNVMRTVAEGPIFIMI